MVGLMEGCVCDGGAPLQTYELMSEKYFTHATPTLFNAGTPHCQLSSCFLLQAPPLPTSHLIRRPSVAEKLQPAEEPCACCASQMRPTHKSASRC